MNQDNNLKFKKSIENNSKYSSADFQNRRDFLKQRLMDKYGVSLDEANEILIQIEKKYNHHIPSKGSQNVVNDEHQFVHRNNSELIQHSVPENNSYMKFKNNNKNFNGVKSSISKPYNHVKNTEATVNNQSINLNDEEFNQLESNNNESFASQRGNVDVNNLLQDILPDYNNQISINVNHVDLTFEVQNEKVDTLKETFIRILKRKKSKKTIIHALKDVSFKIYKGEKVGIIGYNGAGKSTLLNVISGIYPPDKGEVITYGNISPLLSLGAGFDHNFSGRRNIILNGAVLGYDKDYLESKINEIIEFSELGDFIDIPIKNYSSGMLAKLGFSIATSLNPDILIIDEILGVGDVNFAKKSRDKIKSLMDGGTTVLLVSHSIPQVRELCDKAIWIDNGKVIEIGEVNTVCDHYLKDAEKASNEQLNNIQFR